LFWLGPIESFIGIELPAALKSTGLREGIGIGVAVSGILGIICSIMIYDDCKKELWRGSITGLKFFGTALCLGLTTILLAALAGVYIMKPEHAVDVHTVYTSKLSLLMVVAFTAKLSWEATIFRHLKAPTYSMFERSALLMKNHLPLATKMRYFFGAVGGVFIPLVIYFATVQPQQDNANFILGLAVTSFVFALIGELCERFLFFAAVVSKKMPGGI
ncbi:MAG: hypothetical protein NE330_16895, partial [Lentisphaeraceae bacterium]|nr:hypothetical protein [Lentisphaeraceae bacterium]